MLLDNLQLDNDVETQGDFIPGGSFTNPTGIYKCLIELAYMGKSRGGARSVTVHFKQADGGMTHRETFYITSGEAKGCKPYYVKDGKKIALPGYEMIDNLAMLAAGKRLAQLNAEDKVVKLWDWEARKETNQTVPVLTELMGQAVRVGLVLREENKRTKVGDEYVDTNDKREFNEVSKLFHAKGGLTVAEARAGLEDGEFINEWETKYPSDFVRSTYKPVAETGTSSVVEQASAAAAVDSASENSDLFA
jgi:hypothetical protein